MSYLIEILKDLCAEQEGLRDELFNELKDTISYEVSKGIRAVDAQAVLRLALLLEGCESETGNTNFVNEVVFDSSYNNDSSLMKRIFQNPGVDVNQRAKLTPFRGKSASKIDPPN